MWFGTTSVTVEFGLIDRVVVHRVSALCAGIAQSLIIPRVDALHLLLTVTPRVVPQWRTHRDGWRTKQGHWLQPQNNRIGVSAGQFVMPMPLCTIM